jgi:hypothetical protein
MVELVYLQTIYRTCIVARGTVDEALHQFFKTQANLDPKHLAMSLRTRVAMALRTRVAVTLRTRVAMALRTRVAVTLRTRVALALRTRITSKFRVRAKMLHAF